MNNPFHDLWTQTTGEYARVNIRDKGRNPFADMSGEIHGYDQRRRNTLDDEHFDVSARKVAMIGKIHGSDQRRRVALDYEHFDVSARRVAMILHETPIVDNKTGDVDWPQDIRKYPVDWPAKNDLALTLLQRLEGRVADLQRRLDVAVEDQNRERDQIQADREAGEDSGQQRRRDREANDNLLEEDAGLDALFPE